MISTSTGEMNSLDLTYAAIELRLPRVRTRREQVIAGKLSCHFLLGCHAAARLLTPKSIAIWSRIDERRHGEERRTNDETRFQLLDFDLAKIWIHKVATWARPT
jgi:hypothetical protein